MQEPLSLDRRQCLPVGRLPHYIYGLFDPIAKSYFYVGLTANTLKNRLYMHMLHSKLPHLKQYPVSVHLRENKVNPEIHLLEFSKDQPVGLQLERKWIVKLISEGHPLLNILKTAAK